MDAFFYNLKTHITLSVRIGDDAGSRTPTDPTLSYGILKIQVLETLCIVNYMDFKPLKNLPEIYNVPNLHYAGGWLSMGGVI
ncbi:hypothetical protein GDO81_003963 [Engystomops pustulosus]|uniref:Uncharacterized protein n=1 Tax=Engystomops pustulosus TaxID=76066 RepID=A0AAV7A5E4_ENGPU|nr:hypothetical protein GDO81_003963 [Engystomops pustulosus]